MGQDEDKDRQAATGACLQRQLQEEQDLYRRAGEPLPDEEEVDQVGRATGPAAVSDEDVRSIHDNLMHGRRAAARRPERCGTGRGCSGRWGKAPRPTLPPTVCD